MATPKYHVLILEAGNLHPTLIGSYDAKLGEIRLILDRAFPDPNGSEAALKKVLNKHRGAPGRGSVRVVGFEENPKAQPKNYPKLGDEFDSAYEFALFVGGGVSYPAAALRAARERGEAYAVVRGIRIAYIESQEIFSGPVKAYDGPNEPTKFEDVPQSVRDLLLQTSSEPKECYRGIPINIKHGGPVTPTQPAVFAQPRPSEAAPMVQAPAEIPIPVTPDPIKFTI